MINKQSEVIEGRLIHFSVSIIKMAEEHHGIPRSIEDQVVRSAASIGANYAEAQNAASRSDFKNKIFIAKKEAAETRYWLRVIAELIGVDAVSSYLQEVQEILMMLQKIVSSLRSQPAT